MFCRVRPLLSDESAGSENAVISYPTSTEALGRGIDVSQSGMNTSVFSPYSLTFVCQISWLFHFKLPFSSEESQTTLIFSELNRLIQILNLIKISIYNFCLQGRSILLHLTKCSIMKHLSKMFL